MDNYSKELRNFASHLVSHYSRFDRLSQCYTISVNDIADFDIHEFSALIMQSDDAYASEAMGSDNSAYKKTMLPALLTFMKNTTDKDNEIEFVKAWKDGVAQYHTGVMNDLLDRAVEKYNQDEGFTNKEDTGCRRDAGQGAQQWY